MTERSGVHVVTVLHNSASTMRDYFEGLERCSDDVERVTLVDNASTDDTLAVVSGLMDGASFPVEVVENDNAGFAGGYLAARASAAPRDLLVLCLNPDVALSAGAIAAMREAMIQTGDAAVVTTPLVDLDGEEDTASRRRLPTLGPSMVYAVLGRLTPGRLRYNARARGEHAALGVLADGARLTALEATTGALMLVDQRFRPLDHGVFDTDYWMYGEDLQLCRDAQQAGRRVVMVEREPSVHVKGVSAGRPRSTRSNRAFHDAMDRYARKNLIRSRPAGALLFIAVWAHFALTELRAAPVRVVRRARSTTPSAPGAGGPRLRSAS